MATLSSRTVALASGGLALILIITAFAIGKASAGANTVSIQPTVTRVMATPTPTLAERTPHILAAWSTVTVPCDSCYQFTFTANGPFYIVTSCNPFQVFGGNDPSLEVQLFNNGGHLLDTISKTCGDPNKDVVTTNIISESLSAGQYEIHAMPTGAPCSILVLDASQG